MGIIQGPIGSRPRARGWVVGLALALTVGRAGVLAAADDKRKDKPKAEAPPKSEPKATGNHGTGGGHAAGSGGVSGGEERRQRPAPLKITQKVDSQGRHVIETRLKDGTTLQRGPKGEPAELRTKGGVYVQHAPNGVTHIEIEHADGHLVKTDGAGRNGHVQSIYKFHDQQYVQRTYVRNGAVVNRTYRPYYFGNRTFHGYVPNHHYHAAYYGWARARWLHPYPYHWGWEGRPWYGYYGGYFVPYETYAGPAFWLTDFILAATLETIYLGQSWPEAGPTSGGSAPVPATDGPGLTHEVKQLIAADVTRVMAENEEEAAATSPGGEVSSEPPLFSGKGPHVFLVSSGLDAKDNKECALSEGAVLQLVTTPTLESEWVEVKVLANRGATCPKGSIISVKTEDLLELQNQMRATIDDGLDKLQSEPEAEKPKQKVKTKNSKPKGPETIPPVPAAAKGSEVPAYMQDQQPNPNAVKELSDAVLEANLAEQAALAQEAKERMEAEAAEDNAINSLKRGMVIDDVWEILGPALSVEKSGTFIIKQELHYKKVTVVCQAGFVWEIIKISK